MKQFHLLSGTPRSGSTLLSAVLGQNPHVFATPTSPLLELLIHNQHAWHGCAPVKANPEYIQLTNVTRAMIHAMWEHKSEEIIIDKHFGWTPNVLDAGVLFEYPIKIVAPVRDLPGIMASWLHILKKNPTSFVHNELTAKGIIATDEALVNYMWSTMVEGVIHGMNVGLNNARDRILLIDFNDLTNNPKEQLDKIESFLQLPHYDYDLNNIKSDHNDFDLFAWGIDGMHTVKSSITPSSINAREVLGQKLFDKFESIQREMYNW